MTLKYVKMILKYGYEAILLPLKHAVKHIIVKLSQVQVVIINTTENNSR